MESSSKPKENSKISEMKELVKSHIQENRLRRETYLESLRELDKNLDSLNKKLDNIAESAAAAAKIKHEEAPQMIYRLSDTDYEIIDLSFLPLSNVDDLDDLEEKLSSDYDYKQYMVSFYSLFQ